MDWAGRGHNRGLDEYRAKLRRGEVSSDVCNDLADFAADPARAPDEHRISRADRKALARAALMQGGLCRARFASVSGAGTAMFAQNSAGVSAETYAMLLAINDAVANATDVYDLAYRLNQLYAGIAALPPGEVDATYASASVAQSSAEYWQTNGQGATTDLENAYGGCFSQNYTSASEAANTCMGLTGGAPSEPRPQVMLFRQIPGSLSPYSLVQFRSGMGYKDPKCDFFNGREIVGDDFKGAVAGFFGGAVIGMFGGPLSPVTTVGGALGGAVGVGAVASGGAFMWQFAQSLYCTKTGGSGGYAPKT